MQPTVRKLTCSYLARLMASGAVHRFAPVVCGGNRRVFVTGRGRLGLQPNQSHRETHMRHAALPVRGPHPPTPSPCARARGRRDTGSPLPRKGDDVGAADIRTAQRLGVGISGAWRFQRGFGLADFIA